MYKLLSTRNAVFPNLSIFKKVRAFCILLLFGGLSPLGAQSITSGIQSTSLQAPAWLYALELLPSSDIIDNLVQPEEAFFSNVSPSDSATQVNPNNFQISISVNVPAGYELDESTLSGNVSLVEISGSTETTVPANVNDTGGGDAVILTPVGNLKENASYEFRITNQVEANLIGDINTRISFSAFSSQFFTGTQPNSNPVDLSGVSFTKVQGASLGAGINDRFTSLEIGPDGKLYGSTFNGEIKRWDIKGDGTLENLEILTPALSASPHPITGVLNTAPRLIIGFTFDPQATADNLVAYVSHSAQVLTNGPEWDGKLTQLSGPDLGTVKDVVISLPRSVKDHLTNSVIFGPDNALYIAQGSNSAGGEADGSWGFRPERLLAAAVLRLDFNLLPESSWPLDVYTSDDISVINTAPNTGTTMSDGSYNPYSQDSPLTLFSTGIRNAYDLVWHRNGFLYVPTNGTAGNNRTSPNAPGSDAYVNLTGPNAGVRRPNGEFYRYPNFPVIPAVDGGNTQKDWLFRAFKGSYHGHPNPFRGEFVLNHGGVTYSGLPGQTSAYKDVTKYADTILPDPAYVEPAYDFAFNKSPNGAIEYIGQNFGGVLDGLLLVARFSGQDDIIALQPGGSSGDIVAAFENVNGLQGFDDPLELIQDRRTGNLYVAQYDRGGSVNQQLILLRADDQIQKPAIEASVPELIWDAKEGTDSDPKFFTLRNTGSADLEISGVNLAGLNSTQFNLNTNLLQTIPAGDSLLVEMVFSPDLDSLGSLQGRLEIFSNAENADTLLLGVYGLSKLGFQGTFEPVLQEVVTTLGYAIDVGGTRLRLGTGPDPIGDEEALDLFEKAGVGPIVITPVARYSPEEDLPYGWFYLDTNDQVIRTDVDTIREAPGGQNYEQTLFPRTKQGITTFDPGDRAFGIYTNSETFGRIAYTQDNLNLGTVSHRARIYPLKDRQGNPLPFSYLVCYEDASNGDYQDYMFRLDNVKPADLTPDLLFASDTTQVSAQAGKTALINNVLSTSDNAQDVALTFLATEVGGNTPPAWLLLNNNPLNFTGAQTDTTYDFTIDAQGLVEGNYQALVEAFATGYDTAQWFVDLTVLPGQLSIKINFSDENTTAPDTWLKDFGEAFGDRGNRFTYGWKETDGVSLLSLVGNGLNRLPNPDLDTIRETLMHMQYNDVNDGNGIATEGIWELQVPAGVYQVIVEMGDIAPETIEGTRHVLNVEGRNLVDAIAPVSQVTLVQDSIVVYVEDGALSLNAFGGTNAKMVSLRVNELDRTVLKTPEIVTVIPADGSSNVQINTSVRTNQIYLPNPNESNNFGIDPSSVNSTTVSLIDTGSGQAVPADVTLANNNQEILLSPNTFLNLSTSYRLEINGLRDNTGQAFSPFTSSFTTTNQALPAPSLQANVQLLIQDAIAGTGSDTAEIFISNPGDALLEGVMVNLNNTDSSDFSLNLTNFPSTISPQDSAAIHVIFAPKNVGPLAASLELTGLNVPSVTINLSGLGVEGVGGTKEPSLQWILDTQLGAGTIQVGDDDPATTTIHSDPSLQTAALLGDELSAQLFERAADQAVEIEILGVYGPTSLNPVFGLGFYEPDNIVNQVDLFQVPNTPAENAQTLNPALTGTLQFNPGSQPFGLFTKWTVYGNREVYSEDVLNTFSNSIPHHVRVYPLPGEANAYVVAVEGSVTSFDFQDLVFIIRNVRPYTRPIVAGERIQVNFGDINSVAPRGYLKDYGLPFGPRENGQTYGWIDPVSKAPADLTNQGRNRIANSSSNADSLLGTLIHMEHPSNPPKGYWEIELPNGQYEVFLSVGDPLVGINTERHRINVEGINLIDNFIPQGEKDALTRFASATQTIDLQDGRLTFDYEGGGINTKLTHLVISSLLSPSNPPSLSANFTGLSAGTDTYKGNVLVALSASSNSSVGIKSLEYSIDGGLNFQDYLDTLSFGPGMYELRTLASDSLNNLASQTFTFSVQGFSGAQISLENLSKLPGTNQGFPADDFYSFQNIVQADTSIYAWPQEAVIRLNNPGSSPLLVNSLNLSNNSTFNFPNGEDQNLPLVINPVGTYDLLLSFVDASGMKGVQSETLSISSNADNQPVFEVSLRGALVPDITGENELNAEEILQTLGYQTDMKTQVDSDRQILPNPTTSLNSNYPLPEDVNLGLHGDLILSAAYEQANQNEPIQVVQIGAFSSVNTTTFSIIEEQSDNVIPGLGFGFGNQWNKAILPRLTNDTLALAGDTASLIPGLFRMRIGGINTSGSTEINPINGLPENLGIRTYRVIDRNGQVVPFSYILIHDFIGSGCASGSFTCDWNDNIYLINNIKPANNPSSLGLPDTTITVNLAFNYNLAPYFDLGYPGNRLSYSARLSDGSALPEWLSMNSLTGQISGNAPFNAKDSLGIVLEAIDYNGLTVRDTFQLKINGVIQNILVANPDQIAFGQFIRGQAPDTVQVKLENVGNAQTGSLSIQSILLSGNATTEFRIDSSQTVLNLAPGDTSSLEVVFLPDSLGSRVATLEILTDFRPQPVSIPLSAQVFDICTQQNLQFVNTQITPSACNNGTGSIQVQLNGNLAPEDVEYSLGDITSGDGLFADLSPGEYIITGRDLLNMCSVTDTFTVPESGISAEVDVLAFPESCTRNDGRIIIQLDGMDGSNFSFAWDNGMQGDTLENLISGNYTVTITDNTNGCTLSQTVSLTAETNCGCGPIPISWNSGDIGSPALAGDACFNPGGQEFTLQASGTGIGNSNQDNFHYVYRPLNCDGDLVVRLESIGPGNEYPKAGLMIREGLNPEDPYVMLYTAPNPDNLGGVAYSFEQRTAINSPIESLGAASPTLVLGGLPTWFRLQKEGNLYRAFTSPDGTNWTLIASTTFNTNTSLFAGLAISSGDDAQLAEARFSKVFLTTCGKIPVAVARANAQGGRAPLVLQLDASASSDDTGIQEYDWSWLADDTIQTATGINPSIRLDSGSYAITLTVTDLDGNRAQDSINIAVDPVLGPTLRINAGGPEVTLPSGLIFQADQFFTGEGKSVINNNITDIANTEEDAIYLSERSSTNPLGTFNYEVPLIRGAYNVRLHFAEIFWGAPGGGVAGSGQRVFDVTIEGQSYPQLTNLDINDLVGPSAALIIEIPVNLLDDVLNLSFTATADQPKISALEFIPLGNAYPVASAGQDIFLFDDGDGTELVNLDGSASFDADGQITAITWTEGSDTIATTAQTQRILSPGLYTYHLRVVDDKLAMGEDSIQVSVSAIQNLPPSADAGVDITLQDTGDGFERLRLDGSASEDPNNNITQYNWYENGNSLGSGVNLLADFGVGPHFIVLEVIDSEGLSDTDTLLVLVNGLVNIPPLANAGTAQDVIDTNGDRQEFVSVDASASQDPDGLIVRYLWYEGSILLGQGAQANILLEGYGEHTIRLIVTDNRGAISEATQVVNVLRPSQQIISLEAECAEVGHAWSTVEDVASSEGRAVVFLQDDRLNKVGSSSSPPDVGDEKLVTFRFDAVNPGNYHLFARVSTPSFNDDSFWISINGGPWRLWFQGFQQNANYAWVALQAIGQSNPISLVDGENTVRFTYRENGAFLDKIQLRNDGQSPIDFGEVAQNLCEGNLAPLAMAGDDVVISDEGDGQETILLDASGSSDPDGSIIFYRWFQEGTELARIAQPEITLGLGSFSLVLEVQDNQGASDRDTVNISILGSQNLAPIAIAPLNFTVNDTDGDQEELVTLDGAASFDPDGAIVEYQWFEAGVLVGTGPSPQVRIQGYGDHPIDLVVRDNDGASSNSSFTLSLSKPLSQVIALEAECVALSSAWTRVADADASAGSYVVFTENDDNNKVGINQGPQDTGADKILKFDFFLANAGNYNVFARVNTPTPNDDSFWIRINGGPWLLWFQGFVYQNAFNWVSLQAQGQSNPVLFAEGMNTIEITYRENGALVDKIMIRNDGQVPSGFGEPAQTFCGNNLPPVADAGGDITVSDIANDGKEAVFLDATASSDPDGSIESYAWREGNVLLAQVPQGNVEFSSGSHLVVLTVTDDQGAIDRDTISIVVGAAANILPIAQAGPDLNPIDTEGDGLEFITLDALNSNDPDGSLVSYEWFENGQILGNQAQLAITLDSYTPREFVLTVTDDQGASTNDTVRVEMIRPQTQVTTLEAECAEVGAAWSVLAEATASNGHYVVRQLGNSNGNPPEDIPDNQIRFNFHVAREGAYDFYARVSAPSAASDSYWVRINGGPWRIWFQGFVINGGFRWIEVQALNQSSPIALAEGDNTIDFAFREAGTALDKIMVRNDGEIPFTTGLGEEAINLCSPVLSIPALNQILGAPSLSVEAYPNPMENDQIQLQFSESLDGPLTFTLYDEKGIQIDVQTAENTDALNRILLDFKRLQLIPGTYFLQVTGFGIPPEPIRILKK